MTVFQKKFQRKLIGFSMLLGFVLFFVFCFGAFKAIAQEHDPIEAQGSSSETHEGEEPSQSSDPGVIKYAFVAAAIAVGLGSVGAGAAVGYVGAAAMGAIGEKPELAGRALIFVGLAEGIAIYGLIIAIMILGKV
jgi:V/A-type H+-transporting ATPase subunit K